MDPNGPRFDFFRRFQSPGGGFQGPQDQPVHGQASSFIVRGARDLTVKLTDRREFQAEVLGCASLCRNATADPCGSAAPRSHTSS